MICLESISHADFNRLPHVDKMENDHDDKELAKVLFELNKDFPEPLFGISLIHKHFDLAEEEVLLSEIYSENGSLELVTSVVHLSALISPGVYPLIIGNDETGNPIVHQWIKIDGLNKTIDARLTRDLFLECSLHINHLNEKLQSVHAYGLLLNYPRILDFGEFLNERTDSISRIQKITEEPLTDGSKIGTQFFPPEVPCNTVPSAACKKTAYCGQVNCSSSLHYHNKNTYHKEIDK
jgi:hypothetical protein